ncbi:MAG: hypothetical protein AB1489_23625 [Acidobacteriota bacterium]
MSVLFSYRTIYAGLSVVKLNIVNMEGSAMRLFDFSRSEVKIATFYHNPITLFFISLTLLFTACKSSPSDNEIKQAIIENFNSAQKANLKIGSFELKAGTSVKVDLVEVKQIGEFNEQEKYWPVRARVKGTYEANILITARVDFDQELDFKLYQENNGNWKASPLDR